MAKRGDIAELQAMYEQKIKELNAIAELTQGQIALMEADDVEGLMNNIEARQARIDAIDKIDEQIREFALPVKEGRISGSGSIDALKQKIKDMLELIQKQDKANELMATAKLQGYKQAVRKANDGKKTLDTYNRPPSSTDGAYFDIKK